MLFDKRRHSAFAPIIYNYMSKDCIGTEAAMTINFKLRGNNLEVFLFGELDESVAVKTRETLNYLIDTYSFSAMVLDLKGVNFLDSTGMGVVLGRYKKLRRLGRGLFLRNVNAQVDKVFATCGLYDIVEKQY